jgi:hypothetical protein
MILHIRSYPLLELAQTLVISVPKCDTRSGIIHGSMSLNAVAISAYLWIPIPGGHMPSKPSIIQMVSKGTNGRR